MYDVLPVTRYVVRGKMMFSQVSIIMSRKGAGVRTKVRVGHRSKVNYPALPEVGIGTGSVLPRNVNGRLSCCILGLHLVILQQSIVKMNDSEALKK